MLFYIVLFFSFVLCCAKLLQSCVTVDSPMDCSLTRLLCPWNSPGKNTGVGCSALLQGTFPTQGSNPHVYVFCFGRRVLYHQHHLGFCVISSNLCILLCLHIFVSFSILFSVWFLSLILLICFCFMESFLHI